MRVINSVIAVLMLGFMFILLFFSSWNDSATMDELAHIPAGYSYLTQRDYRLNPEHPPLIKDLAAGPLLFLNLNFPTEVKAWKDDVNGQWDMGRIFLYESGNNPDQILRFSRFPIILLALLFGWLLFGWSRKIYGDKVGLLALFFYSFSPTFLAHARYVTTDLAAAFGFFIGIAAFINFLGRRNKRNLIIAGIAFGLAQLLKFSLVLLCPLYVVFGILWVILENWDNRKKILGESLKMLVKIALIGIIGLAAITIVYQFHVSDYPPQRQAADSAFILTSFGFRPAANLVIWMADKPVLRSLGQYLLGLSMVIQRSAGGNTAYFMGEISAASWSSYFPVLYLFKEHLAFHIFALMALVYSIRNILKAKEKSLSAMVGWMKDNFVAAAGIIFVAVYWTQAILSNLNIGVRHVLPTFPFIYLLVSWQIIRWSRVSSLDNPQTLAERIKCAYKVCVKSFKKYSLVIFLALWIILGTIGAFPYYLAYYNELGGGVWNGYKIATDSNYDWGQDLKRLKEWTEKNLPAPPAGRRVAVDYFGGGNPQYYLGEKFEPWWSSKGSPPAGGWFAISATFREQAFAKPVKGWAIKLEDSYSWLKNKKPITRAGISIFIYKF